MSSPARSPDAPLTPRSVGVEVSRGEFGLRLEYRWYRARHVFWAVFALLWDGFTIEYYRSTLALASPPPAMLSIPLLHVAVGVLVTYATLAGFLNRTTLTVWQGTLSIRHHPLPWIGIKRLAKSEIRQLYCDQRFGEHRVPAYHLSVLRKDGRKFWLLRDLVSAELTRFLEQEIEKALGIEDRPVPEEMPR